MKNLLFVILLSICSSLVQAQSSNQPYPEGVYFSLRSFLKKTPDKKVDSLIIRNSSSGLMYSGLDIFRFKYPNQKKPARSN